MFFLFFIFFTFIFFFFFHFLLKLYLPVAVLLLDRPS